MKRILVRTGFTQENIWRDALGYSEPLLVSADYVDCLDAPDFIPAGSTVTIHKFTPAFRPISTIVTRENGGQ